MSFYEQQDRVLALGLVLLGVMVLPNLALIVAWAIFRWSGFWPVAAQPLATLGTGSGVLAAALVAYYGVHKNRALEQEKLLADKKQRLHERFSDIATHLSDTQVFNRMSRVHALSALCDDWGALEDKTQQQVCVDLLKEMLRFPQPDEEALVRFTERAELSAEQRDDLAVRQTIVSIVASRTRSDAKPNWCHLDCRMRSSKLCWADFSGKTLVGLNFSHSLLDRANFNRATVSETSFDGSKIRHANFTRATLAKCSLRSTWLRDTTFKGANLTGAHLDNTQLYGCTFDYADLDDASLAHATTELFSDGPGVLSQTTQFYPDGVRPAKYSLPSPIGRWGYAATFNCASFHRADLRAARLVHADLVGVHLCHARLAGTDFTESYMTSAVLIKATLGPEGSGKRLLLMPEAFWDRPTLLPLADQHMSMAVVDIDDLKTYTQDELEQNGVLTHWIDPFLHSRCYRAAIEKL
ncbi:pentapeptide repeat-containing protein [Mycobacteroides abscessus]|uniref:pentapeptide repeat-containing protein n=1 Tax=Mycobacteroides abscessus TaxID=36809 RepID=UPI0009A66152|nr:pentapeptide repeat-containing protein [Mycobacteroides abscessus]SKI05591.1 Type III effector pipB2 [Mycobacteroides abscessus subsp. massiliense]SLD17195.1 Type III effector pipB2 [Mycobacteroides abscessus subsp. massiliense]SLD88425.1 Type III effector pipB2 [Mycobacteroides abscessus subsp. massiliense]